MNKLTSKNNEPSLLLLRPNIPKKAWVWFWIWVLNILGSGFVLLWVVVKSIVNFEKAYF